MAFLLENAFNGSSLVADADNHPLVRLFTSKKTSSTTPLLEQPIVEQPWAVSSANATSDDGCPKCPNNTFPPARDTRRPEWLGAGEQLRDHTMDDNWLYMSAVCCALLSQCALLAVRVLIGAVSYALLCLDIYGKNIQAHTGKPIGLMNTNWGGTPVEFCPLLYTSPHASWGTKTMCLCRHEVPLVRVC